MLWEVCKIILGCVYFHIPIRRLLNCGIFFGLRHSKEFIWLLPESRYSLLRSRHSSDGQQMEVRIATPGFISLF